MNLEILGSQLATSPYCSENFLENMALGLYFRVSEMPWDTGLENHWPEVFHFHQEPLSTPLIHLPLGMRRVPIPKPGLCVGSSLGLFPKYCENAHYHTLPCTEQLPTGLFGAVNKGKYKWLGPAGHN